MYKQFVLAKVNIFGLLFCSHRNLCNKRNDNPNNCNNVTILSITSNSYNKTVMIKMRVSVIKVTIVIAVTNSWKLIAPEVAVL